METGAHSVPPPFKTVDAPDGEIYCRPCFKKAFPAAETPLIYSDTGAIRPGGDDGGCPRCGGAVFQVKRLRNSSHP